jgi:hypothetical protein
MCFQVCYSNNDSIFLPLGLLWVPASLINGLSKLFVPFILWTHFPLWYLNFLVRFPSHPHLILDVVNLFKARNKNFMLSWDLRYFFFAQWNMSICDMSICPWLDLLRLQGLLINNYNLSCVSNWSGGQCHCSTGFRFAYTTVFGWYAAYLYLRTGMFTFIMRKIHGNLYKKLYLLIVFIYYVKFNFFRSHLWPCYE